METRLPPSPLRTESKERANDLALFFRQTGKETFIQMPLSNETGKDERKLRVPIIECLIDLPPLLMGCERKRNIFELRA